MPTQCKCNNCEELEADKDDLIFCKNCKGYIRFDDGGQNG